ncbi:MAG: dockerin type I domain-containing protein, partial [Ruminococcus sp.]
AASAAGTLSAAAIENPLVYPEGYTECMVNKNNGDIVYVNPSTGRIMAYTEIMYNMFLYDFSDDAPEDTYDKYFKDIFNNDNGCSYHRFVKGDDPRTHESIPDIYDKLKETVDILYKEGLITSAYFAPMTSAINDGYLVNGILINDYQGTEAELQEIADKYYEGATVAIDNGEARIDYSPAIFYPCDSELTGLTGLSLEELYRLRDEIDALYENDNVIFCYSNHEVATSPKVFMFNMLDPYICDIDGNGKVDISDASQILASYSQTATGILKAAETDSMDVNDDGTADAQDASYILSCYAETAAGIR